MGLSCEIFIKQPYGGVHRAGKPINGIIRYKIDKPTKYSDIVLSLEGKGEVRWHVNSTKYNYFYSGNENYVTQHIYILNKNPGQTVTIPFGCYEYPFQFTLPYNIPTSSKYKSGSVKCTISYKVIIKFCKSSLFSFDNKYKKELIVYGNVNAERSNCPAIYGIEKTLFSLFSSRECKVNIKCEIPKSIYMPGENIKMECVIANDSDKIVTSVKSKLICKTNYTSNNGDIKTKKKTFTECTSETPSILENSEAKFNTITPTLPEMYTIQHSVIVDKRYYLKVTVKLPVPYSNKSIDIPLVIGEALVDDTLVDEIDLDITENPPSYWEAMIEDDCKGKN